MRTLLLISIIFACLSGRPAQAILPESGWYWNPTQSGRGFNIEIQDNLLFVAAFAYDAPGNPTWWVAGGPMQSDRSFAAQASMVTGGQCFGCPYRVPGVADAGPISVVFSDEGNATVTFQGEAIQVRRQDFANLGTNPDGLYGEWSTTEGEPILPIYFGERVSFTGPFTSNAGVLYASGGRTGATTTRVALGRYDQSVTSWIMLLDSSSSYYTAYRFRFTGLNRIEGQTWTYLKTSAPSGSGLYFVAQRTKSKARVNGNNAPGVTKAMDNQDAIFAAKAQVFGSPGLPLPPARLLGEMEGLLERLRSSH